MTTNQPTSQCAICEERLINRSHTGNNRRSFAQYSGFFTVSKLVYKTFPLKKNAVFQKNRFK